MSKKKIRPGAIVLAQGEQALVVEYDQEEFETQDDGSLGKLIHSSKGEKKLKVKSLGPDLDALANELMEKCKLIKPSSLPKVKELLGQLQQREESRRSTQSEQHDAQRQIPAHSAQPPDAPAAKPDDAPEPPSRSKNKKSRREKISSAHPRRTPAPAGTQANAPLASCTTQRTQSLHCRHIIPCTPHCPDGPARCTCMRCRREQGRKGARNGTGSD